MHGGLLGGSRQITYQEIGFGSVVLACVLARKEQQKAEVREAGAGCATYTTTAAAHPPRSRFCLERVQPVARFVTVSGVGSSVFSLWLA